MQPTKRPRARDLGIRLGRMQPGYWNAITDVPGVRVGHVSLFEGQGPLVVGRGPVRTGVTVILPHDGSIYEQKAIAAVHTINGYGKATGFEQIRELGVLETPIALTNTLNVGRVWDALVTWTLRQGAVESVNPLVGECNDAFLNDIQGRHVREEHVLRALESAASGVIEEGGVGAGVGMSCYEFKGGIGTASRLVGPHAVGVLVLTNFGDRQQLLIEGVPVGSELRDWPPVARAQDGSVVVVVATDAPLSDRQLGRIARRTGHGLARTGSTAGNSSGDFAIAFSNANLISRGENEKLMKLETLADTELNPYFEAVVEAVEEAVYNSLFKAETVEGQSGNNSPGLPVAEVVDILQRYGHGTVHLPIRQE